MIVLNEQQQKITNEAVFWFYNSSEQIFEFEGEAGTGKSVVLNSIITQLGLKSYEYMAMAYTGQASIVMRLKGFPYARSIHSSLYEIIKIENEIDMNDPFKAVNLQFDTPKYKYEFREKQKGAIDPQVRLFVIDEGYMVPEYMKKCILKHGVKVLVAGDSGQLPPIEGNPAFLTNCHRKLTQLMRQEANNPIVYLAHRARRNEPIHCGLYGNKVLVINDDELSDAVLLKVGNIICGTNKSRDYFNRRVRELLGIASKVPLYGERVICRNNNWFIEQNNVALTNGLAGVISSPYGVDSFDGKSLTIDFLPDLCDLPFERLKIDYEYLISPYNIRNELKNDRFRHVGEKFEFAYALTTHLAQGGEYPCGIYYEEYLRANIQPALNYTGITRFKEYLIYVKKAKKFY